MISRRALVGSGASLAAIAALAVSDGATAQSAQPALPRLKRGMNLAKWLDRPVLNKARAAYGQLVPQDPRTIQPDDLRRLKAMGVDFVRIAVDPGPAILDDGATDRWLAGVVEACREVRAAGLNLVLTLQPEFYTAKFTTDALLDDAALYARYRATLRAVAKGVAPLGPGVIIEPTNEPTLGCRSASRWAAVQAELLADVRGVSQTLPVVLTGGCSAGVPSLRALPGLADPFVYYTFHYYDPSIFTLQTAQVRDPGARYGSEIPYPPSSGTLDDTLTASWAQMMKSKDLDPLARAKLFDSQVKPALTAYFQSGFTPETITRSFDSVGAWADGLGLGRDRVLLGEFGVFGADPWRGGPRPEDRARWIKDVRLAAEHQGFAWAYYNFTSPFGVFLDEKARRYDPAVLDSLGLAMPGGR